jgi:hypothetical protein
MLEASPAVSHPVHRSWRLHRNLAESVDLLLTNRPTNSEVRWFDKNGQMQVSFHLRILVCLIPTDSSQMTADQETLHEVSGIGILGVPHCM